MIAVSDPRSPAVLEAAERALVKAEAAEVAASAAVDEAREQLALGRIKLGDLLRSQRILAVAQETTERSRGRIRAANRREQLGA